MINLIKADFYKINRSLIYKVLFIITSICAVITTVVSHRIQAGDMDFVSAGTVAMLTDVVMLTLVNCVVAGQLICGDFENKLIQSALTGTSSRLTVVCAKMVSYTGLISIMSLPFALCSLIGAATKAGFSLPYSASVYLAMLSDATQNDVTGGMLVKFAVISLVMVLVYTAQAGIVFLMGFLIKNKPLVVTIIGYLICTVIGMSSSLFGDSMEKIMSYSPFSADMYSLSSGSDYVTIAKVALISLAWIVAFTAASFAAFRKAEIK